MILQAKILLLLSVFLPFLNFLIKNFVKKLPNFLENLLDKAFPAIFLAILIGILNKINSVLIINIFDFGNFFNFSLVLNKQSFAYLSFTGFSWLILSFYFKKLEDENSKEVYKLLLIAIFPILLLIISKSFLLSFLVFLSFSLINYYFSKSIFAENDDNLPKISLFFSFFSAFLLILAIFLSYKINLNFDFAASVNLLEKSFSSHLLIAFFLYFFAFLSFFIFSFYLFFYKKINFEISLTYIFLFIINAFPSLFLFSQILSKSFGWQNLELAFSLLSFDLLNIFILAILTIFSLGLVFAKDLENSFFYLIFIRILLAFFALVFFARFVESKIYLPLLTIFLEITLGFLTISNLSNFLKEAKKDKLIGIFYNLPVTSLTICAAILAISGFFPAISLVEKFYLLKLSIINSSYFAFLIVAANSFFILVFFLKNFLPLFFKGDEKLTDAQIEIAKNFDFDSRFMFSALILTALLFFSLVIIF